MTETEKPCADCGEPTINDKRCRDCDIQHMLDQMECKACGRMRYRMPVELGTTGETLDNLAGAIWGKPCECPREDP